MEAGVVDVGQLVGHRLPHHRLVTFVIGRRRRPELDLDVRMPLHEFRGDRLVELGERRERVSTSSVTACCARAGATAEQHEARPRPATLRVFSSSHPPWLIGQRGSRLT